MDGILGTLASAVGMFAGTNVDDIIVLTVLFLSSRAGGAPRTWQIWTGQYLGIAALVLVSVVAALGLTIVPDDYVGLLGLVPFGLGIWALVRALRARADGSDGPAPAVASGLASVIGVTVANGADNISVYTPVFRAVGVGPTILTIAVFAAGVAVWCLVGAWLGSHTKVVAVIERYGQWIVPLVFMAIGAFIALESGVLGKIL
ncbi:cadmium resistance transporter [Microtetraspora malaysiensis]|uniref:Cadmium resistance transporter n=1 Tax=Microtetraspora malaysiensis TaxID=161358 RepID=A0ABW6SN23_9ACTN